MTYCRAVSVAVFSGCAVCYCLVLDMTYCRAVSVAMFSRCVVCNCDVCGLLQGCQCCCVQWVCGM